MSNGLILLIKILTGLAMLALLCACSLQAQKEALLPVESEQARAEIIALVSQSLGGKNIPIAKDVFQTSSRLLLGRAAVISPAGVNVYPADKVPPLVFKLVKQGEHCLLLRTDIEQTWQLMTTRCFAR
jgi:hypothetical protein